MTDVVNANSKHLVNMLNTGTQEAIPPPPPPPPPPPAPPTQPPCWLRSGGGGGKVGVQPLKIISPTASWIRWCMQVYAGVGVVN